MTTSGTIFFIVIAAGVAVLLITMVFLVADNKRKHRCHVEADKVREAARLEKLQVRQQDALAYQTAATAHAAQDEADVKAAQASDLHQQPPPTAARRPPHVTS